MEAFDCSLSALSSKLLLEERKEEGQSLVDLTFSSHWGATVYLLLDLLEALTAASCMCETEVCQRTRTIIQSHSSALLLTISCSCDHSVKKRTLLLLKRTLSQKLGEDWSLGVSTGLKYNNLSSDMSMLAQCVLTAVTDNWLQNVQVEPAAFFGGARHIQGDEGQKPDGVMLRAISLILLKSIELQIQRAGAAGENPGGRVPHWYTHSLHCLDEKKSFTVIFCLISACFHLEVI